MNFGKLDRRITIQVATSAQSDTGEVTLTWAEYAQRWASVMMLSSGSNEDFEEAQRVATQTADFVIRYDSNIKPDTYRLLYNSDIYDIKRVHEKTDDRRNGYTLMFAEYKDDE